MKNQKITFGLVPGAFHGAWVWDEVATEISKYNDFDSVAIELQREDPDATYLDDVRVLMKACHNRPNLHLVLWSRAGLLAQTALRYMDIEAIQFINAAVEKPYGLPEDPSLPNRMSKQFEEAIINTAPGMTTLDRSKAVELLYEDCSERVALKAVSRLTDQRSLKPPPVYSTWIDVPVSFIACDKDRVVNPEWTQRIANEWYNTEPVWLSGGHTPQLAQPVELAYRIMEEAKFQARARLLDRPQPAVQLHTAPR